MPKKRMLVQEIAIIGLLIACQIILSRFLSISTSTIKIGFSFIPIAIALRYFGIKKGILVAALGDFIGAILFPIGAYFVGYTITAIIRSFIIGMFISKKINVKRICLSTILSELVCSVLLNTYWTTFFVSTGFILLLPSRLTQSAVMTVVQIFVLYILFIKKKNLFDKIIPKQ